jgi:hypothetical protein
LIIEEDNRMIGKEYMVVMRGINTYFPSEYIVSADTKAEMMDRLEAKRNRRAIKPNRSILASHENTAILPTVTRLTTETISKVYIDLAIKRVDAEIGRDFRP